MAGKMHSGFWGRAEMRAVASCKSAAQRRALENCPCMTSNNSTVEETLQPSMMMVVNEGGGCGRVHLTPSHGFLLVLISRSFSSKNTLCAFLVTTSYDFKSSGLRVILYASLWIYHLALVIPLGLGVGARCDRSFGYFTPLVVYLLRQKVARFIYIPHSDKVWEGGQ